MPSTASDAKRGGRACPGFSILEILVAVVILAMAVIPIFSISTSTTRSAQLVGRHMTASQIGQSLLEWFVAQPYKDALQEAFHLKDQVISVPEDYIFRDIVARSLGESPESVLAQFHKTFRMMKYRIDVVEREEPEHGPVACFRITLFYRLVEEASSLRETSIAALKFPEDV